MIAVQISVICLTEVELIFTAAIESWHPFWWSVHNDLGKEANYPYQFIVLDTITALEDMVKPLALKLYLDTVAGSKFTGKNILDAPMGKKMCPYL